MTEKEYSRLKQRIEDERRKSLEALERIWSLSKGSGNGSKPRSPVESAKSSKLKQAILNVLPALSGEFIQKDVEEKIKVHDPVFAESLKRASISMALKRIAGEEKIELLEVGKGKRATRYRTK
jgi:hypothetical protein